MTALTDEKLDELERFAEKATPGNWIVNRIKGYCDNRIETDHPEFVERKPFGHVVAEVGLHEGDKNKSKFERDSEFIAAADPPTVLSLVREVRRLRGKSDAEPEAEFVWPEPVRRTIGKVVSIEKVRDLHSDLAAARARIVELERVLEGR